MIRVRLDAVRALYQEVKLDAAASVGVVQKRGLVDLQNVLALVELHDVDVVPVVGSLAISQEVACTGSMKVISKWPEQTKKKTEREWYQSLPRGSHDADEG